MSKFKRPASKKNGEVQFPTGPIAKLGMAAQSGVSFTLTEQERADAEKAIAEIEEMKLAGKLPRNQMKRKILESVHKMLRMSLEYDGKEIDIEFDPAEKYRNKL